MLLDSLSSWTKIQPPHLFLVGHKLQPFWQPSTIPSRFSTSWTWERSGLKPRHNVWSTLPWTPRTWGWQLSSPSSGDGKKNKFQSWIFNLFPHCSYLPAVLTLLKTDSFLSAFPHYFQSVSQLASSYCFGASFSILASNYKFSKTTLHNSNLPCPFFFSPIQNTTFEHGYFFRQTLYLFINVFLCFLHITLHLMTIVLN